MDDKVKNVLQQNRDQRGSLLNLSDLDMDYIPNLCSHTWVTSIRAENNRIVDINFDKLPPLVKSLFLKNNNINKIDEEKIPPNITYLDLTNNKINYIYPEKLKHVRHLFIENNLIVQDKIEFPPHCIYANYSRCLINKIGDLPDGMIYLYCSENYLKELPKMNIKLREINFSNNHVSTLPSFYDSVTQIIGDNNYITFVSNLPSSLQKLSLKNNLINIVYDDFSENLMELDLSGNLIKRFPKLPNQVISVDFSDNKIDELGDIPDYTKKVYICGNNITGEYPEYITNRINENDLIIFNEREESPYKDNYQFNPNDDYNIEGFEKCFSSAVKADDESSDGHVKSIWDQEDDDIEIVYNNAFQRNKVQDNSLAKYYNHANTSTSYSSHSNNLQDNSLAKYYNHKNTSTSYSSHSNNLYNWNRAEYGAYNAWAGYSSYSYNSNNPHKIKFSETITL